MDRLWFHVRNGRRRGRWEQRVLEWQLQLGRQQRLQHGGGDLDQRLDFSVVGKLELELDLDPIQLERSVVVGIDLGEHFFERQQQQQRHVAERQQRFDLPGQQLDIDRQQLQRRLVGRLLLPRVRELQRRNALLPWAHLRSAPGLPGRARRWLL